MIIRALNRMGWVLMGLPWRSHETMRRSFQRNDWHARLYSIGGRLCGYQGRGRN